MNDIYLEIQKEFNKLMEVKGYKTGNGKMYPQVVREFLNHHSKKGKHSLNFSQQEMVEYHQYLSTRKNKRRPGTLSDQTINHHLFGIGLLFEYLLDNKRVDALPVIPKFLRSQKTEMDILTIDQIKELYEVANPLERAILSIAYGAGLRRSEIEQLNIEHVRLRDGFVIVEKGKNSKRREVPLSNKVVKDLKSYLHEYRHHSSMERKSFFINEIGTRMRGDTLNRRLKQLINRSSIQQEVTLHTLRRSIATHLVENGAGIYFVKDFLGHSQIDTSHLYAIKRNRKAKLY